MASPTLTTPTSPTPVAAPSRSPSAAAKERKRESEIWSEGRELWRLDMFMKDIESQGSSLQKKKIYIILAKIIIFETTISRMHKHTHIQAVVKVLGKE